MNDDLLTTIPETHSEIARLSTRSLFAILRAPNKLNELFCNQLTWAKAELRSRGFSVGLG